MNLSRQLVKYMLILFLTVGMVSVPTICSATNEVQQTATNEDQSATTNDDEEEDEQENEEKETETYQIGVNRLDNLEENKEIFTEQITGIAKIGFGFFVFVAILGVGFGLIVNSQDGKARAGVAQKFKNIILGVVIFAVMALIVGVASQLQEKAIEKLYGEDYDELLDVEEIDDKYETDWEGLIFESFFKMIGKVLEYLVRLLFMAITGTEGEELDFNKVIFLSGFGDSIDLESVNESGQKLTTAPFSVSEWDKYTTAYFLLSSVAIPLMLLALLKVAYSLVINNSNFESVSAAKKSALRICIGMIIVILGPYGFRMILTFFNMLTFLIPVKFKFDITMESIHDSNGMIAILTGLWWIVLKFKIMLTFIVREIMLTVLYISTPLMIGIWTISDKFKSFQMWLGELITNSATQFCYAMVFFMATIVLHGGKANAFLTLLWLSMMIKLADFFKDSIQGIIGKWGGIQESSVASDMFGKASNWLGAAGDTFTKKIDENGIMPGTRMYRNARGFSKFLRTGDISGFVGKGESVEAQGKGIIKSGNDDLRLAFDMKRTGLIDTTIASSANAKLLQSKYEEYNTTNDAARKNELEGEINKLYENNKGDKYVQNIKDYNDLLKSGNEKVSSGILVRTRGKLMKKKYSLLSPINYGLADNAEQKAINYARVRGTSDETMIASMSNQKYKNIERYNKIIEANDIRDINGENYYAMTEYNKDKKEYKTSYYSAEDMKRLLPAKGWTTSIKENAKISDLYNYAVNNGSVGTMRKYGSVSSGQGNSAVDNSNQDVLNMHNIIQSSTKTYGSNLQYSLNATKDFMKDANPSELAKIFGKENIPAMQALKNPTNSSATQFADKISETLDRKIKEIKRNDDIQKSITPAVPETIKMQHAENYKTAANDYLDFVSMMNNKGLLIGGDNKLVKESERILNNAEMMGEAPDNVFKYRDTVKDMNSKINARKESK